MTQPLNRYRANIARSVFIGGVIDAALLKEITPQILKLRAEGSEPITVFINSPGGYIVDSDTIYDIIKAPDPDGNTCQVTTVVVGAAKSAAADLLTYGDYAIAYPQATVHCHGSRYFSEEELTMEKAFSAAASLRGDNEKIALRLSRFVVERVIFNFLNVSQSIEQLKTDPKYASFDDVECLSHVLLDWVSPETARIIRRASRRYQSLKELNRYVFRKVRFRDSDTIREMRAKILKVVTDHHVMECKKYAMPFDTETIVESFNLVDEYHTGEYATSIRPLAERWGTFFLNSTDTDEYKRLDVEPAVKIDWLVEHSKVRIQALLFFAFSLCNLLQESENKLSATDAYWVGIVDEVLGSDLPCLREMFENPPAPPATSSADATSSSSSAPPPSQPPAA